MLLSDIGGLALVSAAVLGAVVVMGRRTGHGACGGCGYALAGLPAEVACCPECGRERGKRRSRWRRLGTFRFAVLVAVALVGAGLLLWPRREAVMERMPSRVLLAAERLGYARGLELVTMRAHAGELSAWTERVFVDRVTERLMEDSVAVTWPRSNSLYVYTQLAMLEVEAAREGLRRVFRSGAASTVDDVVQTLAYIRVDAPGAMAREALQHNRVGVADFRQTERGRLYGLMTGDPLWLGETMLEVLDRAQTEGEAVGTLVLIKQLFTDGAFAERVVARLADRPWTAARSSAEEWRDILKSPRMRGDWWGGGGGW